MSTAVPSLVNEHFIATDTNGILEQKRNSQVGFENKSVRENNIRLINMIPVRQFVIDGSSDEGV